MAILKFLKAVWDLLWYALFTVVFIYVFWKTFIFCGDRIPLFGYVPIGVIAGLTTSGLAIAVVGAIQYLIEAGVYIAFEFLIYLYSELWLKSVSD